MYLQNIQAIGARTFDLALSTCSVYSPTRFRWTDQSAEAQVYFDEYIIQGAQSPRHSQKFGWLVESIGHRPDIYEHLVKHYRRILDNYVAIFTSVRHLLSLDSRFVFCYSGSNLPWIRAEAQQIYQKSKLCSMIASPINVTTGHRLRHELAARLKPELDLFGGAAGSLQVRDADQKYHSDKLSMLQDYMFSVTIENASYETYFTEKIADCFATGTVPVYWGSPDIGDYFNSSGIIKLSPDFHPRELSAELYQSMLPAVQDNFNRVREMQMADDYLYDLIFGTPLKSETQIDFSESYCSMNFSCDLQPAERISCLPIELSLSDSNQGITLRGFHEIEDWGCWTSLPLASIHFPFFLPKKFNFRAVLLAEAPNVGSQIKMIFGNHTQQVTLSQGFQEVVFEVHAGDSCSSIELEIPRTFIINEHLTIPDGRAIGVGVVKLTFT